MGIKRATIEKGVSQSPKGRDLRNLANKKVLLGSNTLWSLYNFRHGLIVSLIEQGAQVLVVAPKDAYAKNLIEMGCQVVFLTMKNEGLNPLRELAVIIQYVKLLRSHRPDICLWYTIKPTLYGSIASLTSGTPVFCTVTGLGTAFIAGGPLRLIAKILFKLTRGIPERVFVQNRDDLGLFIEEKLAHKSKLVLVPGSGVDLKRFRWSPLNIGNKIRFLFVGRLLRDKGIYEYVSAASRILGKFDSVEFWIVGALDIPNRTAIKAEEINSWVDQGVVKYLGEVKETWSIIKAADCVVLPSYREGLPRSLMEACAVGRAVITTDVPGCREIVDHGDNGYLCRPRECLDLYENMTMFIELPPPGKVEMGRRARLKAEVQFGEGRVVSEYLKHIQAVLNTDNLGGNE